MSEFDFLKSAVWYGYKVRWRGLLIGQVWSDNDSQEGCEPASYWEADGTEQNFPTKEAAAVFLRDEYKALMQAQ